MAEQTEPLTITVTGQQQPPQESSMGDYMNLLSPFGIQGQYDYTRTRTEDLARTGVDLSDENFKALFDSADIQTRKEMLSARNNNDAMRIYDRRQIFMQSQERVAQDGLVTQIAMGALPALASPTTLLPFGGVMKVAQTANKARKLKMALAGATTATTANLMDEAMLDAQGLPTNYVGVAATSAILGGGLGMLGGMLSSPKAINAADHMLEQGNVLSKDYVSDNFVTIDRNSETLLIPKVKTTLYDKIPGLGEWFKSPVTKMYQSDSSVVRSFAARISNPTVSLKDANGNYVVLGKTGADVKQEIVGNFNSKVNVPISKSYDDWVKEGNKGSRADFNKEVYRVYAEESNRLANAAKVYADENAAVEIVKINEDSKQAMKESRAPSTFYRDSKGREQPASQEVVDKYQADWAEYQRQVEEQRIIKEERIPALDAQYKVDAELAKELLKAQGVKGKALTEQMKTVRANLREQLKADKAELRASVKPKRPREIEFYDKKPDATKEGRKALAERLKELKAERNAAKEKARETHVDTFYRNNNIEFKTGSSAIKDAATAYSKYFDDMLVKGQNLGIKELAKSKAGRLYAPRNWDFGKMATLPKEEVKQRLRAAIEADARNEYNTIKDLEDDIEDLYNLLIKKESQSTLGQGKGYYTKDLPFEKRLASRKLYLDESKLGNLVHNNFEDVAGMYNYFMSGRMAVQHAFGDMIDETGNLAGITDRLVQEAVAKGETVSAKERDNIVNTIDDLLGVRRMSQFGDKWQWELSRNLMTYNSARLMGGAGGNQLIEMATIAMMNASRGIIMKNFSTSASNVAKMLYKETGPSNDLGKVLLNSGYLESALHAHRANRIADTEAGFNPKLLEGALDNLADFQMKYNGQRYFTALAEDMSGGAIMQYIQRASIKDEALFSRWGLTMKDVQSLKKVLDKDNKNFLENMSQYQRDKFQMAINRGVAEWVVQPNSIHLPDWFKGAGPMQKLLFQFMKFPMIAQETLLRRGWTEDKAGMIAGIAGAMVMYTTLKYLREEASVALGFTDERDRKYDIFGDREQMFRATLESTNYMANLGMFTTAWNYGNAFLQRPELGREWANRNAIEAIGGPTVGLVQDISDIGSRLVNDGDFTSERQMKSYKQLAPFMALPGLSEGLNALAAEFGD
jgi:hypothetical protein